MKRYKTPVAVLRAMKRLFEQGRWAQHEYVASAKYLSRDDLHPSALCYCMIGAVHRLGADGRGTRMEVIGLLTEVLKVKNIFVWNDDPKRTLKQVIRAVDKAIKLAEAKRGV